MANTNERLLYCMGLVCSIGSGTVLPLMTLIFGNFVTVFSNFALGQLSNDAFMSEVSHYTYVYSALP